ncbi:MAG: protein-L-isoaspartate(D-aspartate) O-methyltransferase [Thermomicrobiales bacterium]
MSQAVHSRPMSMRRSAFGHKRATAMQFRSRSENQRKQALLDQLRKQGIRDGRVLDAMERIPRQIFVEPGSEEAAWDNTALAIPHSQTISQPFVVALMSQALELTGTERVLEVGTGSGYQAALLAMLAREVITIERIPELAESAVSRFEQLGLNNVMSIVGDGALGWEPGAPYDAIIVTAGARFVPSALLEQLSDANGRMVIPVGRENHAHLRRLRKQNWTIESTDLGAVRFVPLITGDEDTNRA